MTHFGSGVDLVQEAFRQADIQLFDVVGRRRYFICAVVIHGLDRLLSHTLQISEFIGCGIHAGQIGESGVETG